MVIIRVRPGGGFEAESAYDDRHALKAAGFRWDPDRRRWWTSSPVVAGRLRHLADPQAGTAIDEALAGRDEAIAASHAASADIAIPAPPGQAYMPFQRAGIAYAMRQYDAGRRGVLIADEMGLGKTIQAIGVINALDASRVLIVCPASLKIHWHRELSQWLTRQLTVGMANGSLPAANVVIVNYDLLRKYREELAAAEWDLVIVDEAHYAKNPKAQRTVALFGGGETKPLPARRWLFLTGTPILNRPIELFGICRFCAPDEFGSWHRFVTRYCAGRQTRYGWDVSGASHLEELQERLRATMMVRRRKADVLTELPPKIRQVIEVTVDGATALVREEAAAWERHDKALAEARAQIDLAEARDNDEEYRAAVERLREATRAAFEEIAELRHRLALRKVPAVVEHVTNASGKVVVFAHHRDVIAGIAEGLSAEFGAHSVAVLTGEMPISERQDAIDRFQSEQECRFFVASLKAAGVGLTLTAASHVVFAELDWVPAAMTQAEDRCHRIGQRDTVLVQHLVVDRSLDATMARALTRKQALADAALDQAFARRELEIPIIPSGRRDGDEVVPYMSAEQAASAHEAMRCIAGSADQTGIEAIDQQIVAALASESKLTARQAIIAYRVARKYRSQLPARLVEVMELAGEEVRRDGTRAAAQAKPNDDTTRVDGLSGAADPEKAQRDEEDAR